MTHRELKTRQDIIAQYWVGVEAYLNAMQIRERRSFKTDAGQAIVKINSLQRVPKLPIVVGFALVVAEYCARVTVPSIGCPTQVAEDQLHKPVHKVAKFLVNHYGHSIYPPSTENKYASTLKAMGILWLRGQLFK